MKIPKINIISRKRSVPDLQFADQDMTSFAGLVVFLSFFQSFNLSAKLKNVCSNLTHNFKRQYCHGKILECLIIHCLLGYRNLRDQQFYKDDPLVKRTLNLQNLPSVPTISRMLQIRSTFFSYRISTKLESRNLFCENPKSLCEFA